MAAEQTAAERKLNLAHAQLALVVKEDQK